MLHLLSSSELWGLWGTRQSNIKADALLRRVGIIENRAVCPKAGHLLLKPQWGHNHALVKISIVGCLSLYTTIRIRTQRYWKSVMRSRRFYCFAHYLTTNERDSQQISNSRAPCAHAFASKCAGDEWATTMPVSGLEEPAFETRLGHTRPHPMRSF